MWRTPQPYQRAVEQAVTCTGIESGCAGDSWIAGGPAYEQVAGHVAAEGAGAKEEALGRRHDLQVERRHQAPPHEAEVQVDRRRGQPARVRAEPHSLGSEAHACAVLSRAGPASTHRIGSIIGPRSMCRGCSLSCSFFSQPIALGHGAVTRRRPTASPPRPKSVPFLLPSCPPHVLFLPLPARSGALPRTTSRTSERLMSSLPGFSRRQTTVTLARPSCTLASTSRLRRYQPGYSCRPHGSANPIQTCTPPPAPRSGSVAL